MNNVSIFTIIYAILALISLLMVFVYIKMIKTNKNRNGLILFISVFLVIFGYFVLSCSRSLMMALLGNIISYIGSIALIVEMYIIINDFCNGTKNKTIIYCLMFVSILVLLLILSGGTNITLYYKSVKLIKEDNLSILVKEYGPLHNVYTLYVIAIFALMISRIIYSIVTKTIKYYVNPIVLVLLGSENIFVWFAQRFVDTKLQLLAVSYIITEVMLIMVYKNADEYNEMASEIEHKKHKTVENIIEEWSSRYSLTEREIDILRLLIDNIARADIAKSLYISEHTVKKHTANLYDKLCVTSRNDLLYKLNEEICS